MEEAAVVAAEYISSLDNLPQEISHLLFEIKHKDNQVQEIQQEIQKESQKYVRHAKRDGQPLTPKDNQVPQKILAYYAEADKLSEEKIRLTERIEELITRTRARLDHDLAKVLRLQGDDVPQGMHSYSSFGRAATQQIQESLRAASISLPEAVPIAPVAAASTPPSAPPPTKRRKVTHTQPVSSIKLPSPAPMAVAPTRARLTQQQSHRASPARTTARRASTPSGNDEDAEGDDDIEENADENDDEALYCFCQKPSYGEMVGCENDNCTYEWFHLDCVKLKPPLPEHWWCSDCIKKGVAQPVLQSVTKKKKRQ